MKSWSTASTSTSPKMLTKEDVIHRIGERYWDRFEIFMADREVELDDFGLELYYVGDVNDFKDLYNIH